MIIDSIQNGIVIDHISAGKAMELYRILGLDKLDCTVAILKNVTSGKLGRKDIIKIDREMELDWDLIGYVDPSITVNSIRDGQLVEKRTLKLPERIPGQIGAGQAGTLPLDQNTQLHQIAEKGRVDVGGIIAHDGRQGLRRGVAHILGHIGPLAGNDTQKAHPLQIQDSLVDGAAAYPHLQRKLPLRRQPVPRLQLPGQNFGLHQVDELRFAIFAVLCLHSAPALASVCQYFIIFHRQNQGWPVNYVASPVLFPPFQVLYSRF